MKNQHRYHYGIIGYGFLLMFIMYAIQSLQSLFMVPVTESLNMQRSEFSLVFSIGGLAMAFAVPVVVKFLQRYSAKIVITTSILLASIGFAAFSVATKSWHFYLIAVVMGIGMAGCTNMVISLMVNNWFEDRKGLAMGIVFTGNGFGVALLTPLMTYTLTQYGWQFSYVFFGAMMGVICLPFTWLLAYKKPEERGVTPYRDEKRTEKAEVTEAGLEMTGAQLQDIKFKPFFWLYMVSMFLIILAIGGIHSHIIPYLTDLGHSGAFSSFVFSLLAISMIVGKILLGAIFDSKGSRAGLLFLGVCFTVGIVCLLMAKQSIFAIIFALFYGCGCIMPSVGISYLTASYFGQRDYAEILSIVNVLSVVGGSLGPFLSGVVYDIMGGYQLIWTIELVGFVLAIIALWWLKGYLKRYQNVWRVE